MRRTRKVLIVLALVALTAVGIGLARGLPQLATAAEQPQSLDGDTLFFVSGAPASIHRISVDAPGLLGDQTAVAATESILINSTRCDIAGLHASPNGLWVAVEVGCGASVHTQIMAAATGEVYPRVVGGSFFLNWAPDGDSYLLRVGHLGRSAVLSVNARDGRIEQMDTPEFTYDVVFSPDGERVLYAMTRGLGFGSEVWTMDRDGRNRVQIVNDPGHVIIYPRWSPMGDSIAYIRMEDSNVPFTVGELVLADGDGCNERVIASADAGHGYAPVWSPDGKQVAFVMRENPEDHAADVVAQYLTSNIYVADAASGNVRAVTRFDSALTNGPTWSPDGVWLAYSTNTNGGPDVWVVEVASGEMQQVTRNADARCPVWLSEGGQ